MKKQDVRDLTPEEVSKLGEEVFDRNDTDVRYFAGMAALYARMAAKLTGRPAKEFRRRAEAFINRHPATETRRLGWGVHPDSMKEIINDRG